MRFHLYAEVRWADALEIAKGLSRIVPDVFALEQPAAFWSGLEGDVEGRRVVVLAGHADDSQAWASSTAIQHTPSYRDPNMPRWGGTGGSVTFFIT
jgi:hypothetical protein